MDFCSCHQHLRVFKMIWWGKNEALSRKGVVRRKMILCEIVWLEFSFSPHFIISRRWKEGASLVPSSFIYRIEWSEGRVPEKGAVWIEFSNPRQKGEGTLEASRRKMIIGKKDVTWGRKKTSIWIMCHLSHLRATWKFKNNLSSFWMLYATVALENQTPWHYIKIYCVYLCIECFYQNEHTWMKGVSKSLN